MVRVLIPRRASVVVAALFFSGAVAASPGASAQTPNHRGFAFGTPAGEALLALGIGLSNAASALPQRATDWGPDSPRAFDARTDLASDFTGAYGGAVIVMGGGYAFERAYFLDAGAHGGGFYALHGSLVDLESAGLTRALVDVLKRVTGRCRPMDFVNGACKTSVRDSFPSGHTAPMAAIAATRLLTAAETEGPSGFRWSSFAMAESLAISTAILRVRAGKHSWSDVATGFALGHVVGLLIALAHPMRHVDPQDYTPPETTSQGGFALGWSGTF